MCDLDLFKVSKHDYGGLTVFVFGIQRLFIIPCLYNWYHFTIISDISRLYRGVTTLSWARNQLIHLHKINLQFRFHFTGILHTFFFEYLSHSYIMKSVLTHIVLHLVLFFRLRIDLRLCPTPILFISISFSWSKNSHQNSETVKRRHSAGNSCFWSIIWNIFVIDEIIFLVRNIILSFFHCTWSQEVC